MFAKTNYRAFTLTEFIIGLIVAAILILMVGVISQTANDSYNALNKEARVFGDLSYGLDLVEKSVRKAQTVSVDTLNKTLTTDNIIFQKNNSDFIYSDTTDNSNHTIMSGVNILNFTPNGRLINVTIEGEKDNEPFNITSSVTRRN